MKSALSALSYIIESTKKVYIQKRGKGMDRMAEVKERLKIMEDAGMISCGVSEFCMMAAGLILAEHQRRFG
mgnify:CR=1 FL=1